VVVGYASTLPSVINQLSGDEVSMRDDEFDALYVVVIPSPGETRVLRFRYGEPTPPPKARSSNKDDS
jgi:hypothetical protein